MRPCVTPRPVRYALGPEPGSLPQDHPGSGVVAPWLPPGQLHGMSSTSPSSPCCPVCCMCIGASTVGGARGSEAASTAYSFGDFPRKDALDARLPPPASRHARSGDRTTTLRLRDLRLARLSEPGILVCVCVCCGGWLYHFYQVSRLSPYRPHWRPRVGSLTPS